MFKQVFSQFSDTHLAVTGFLLFIITFLGVLTWTVFIQKKSFYDKLSLQPLDGGDQNGK
jgi:hypothetical protein